MAGLGRLLITGGAGFIGANLIARLRAQGHAAKIRVLDNECAGSRKVLLPYDVDFMRGDIGDPCALRTALRDVDQVVHLAADTGVIGSVREPAHNFRTNVAASFDLLCAMRALGVRRIVNASTGGAIAGNVPPPVHEDLPARPLSPYGASKLAMEGYCTSFAGAYEMTAVSLRFSNVYGPLSFHKGSVVAAFLRNILDGRPLTVYGDGSQTRDYVYVDDLADGIVRALGSDKSDVYQLGSGRPTALRDLIGELARVTDRTPEIRYEDFRNGEVRHSHCDITKAQSELGFTCPTGLTAGIGKTWAWFKDRHQTGGA